MTFNYTCSHVHSTLQDDIQLHMFKIQTTSRNRQPSYTVTLHTGGTHIFSDPLTKQRQDFYNELLQDLT